MQRSRTWLLPHWIGLYRPPLVVHFSLTEPATGTNAGNWLQLDLGREYEVKKVVIYPVQFDEDLDLDFMNRKF